MRSAKPTAAKPTAAKPTAAKKRSSKVRTGRRLELDFPARLVNQPILYELVKKFDLVPNVRRASVTQKFGYIQLELLGSEVAIEKGIRYLIKRGIRVEPIVKDVLES